jgi:four helix bundle protein
MKIERFEDIKAWQKAGELSLLIYGIFKDSKDYRFKDQIQSAAVSIMNNIAEGFDRKGNKEFKRFLYIAKGSCAEVKSMLYLAFRLKYVDKKEFETLKGCATEISKMLYVFITKL